MRSLTHAIARFTARAKSILPLCMLATGALATAPVAQAQLLVAWGGGNGSWNIPANWQLGALPLAGDTAQISTGAPSVDSAVAIAGLQLSGGGIGGGATLTLTGTGSTWTAGSLFGPGTLALATGASLSLGGADHKNLYHGSNGAGGHTLDNSGTVTWTGAGNLLVGDGAQIVNRAGATFALQNDASFAYVGFGNGGAFTNAGSFVKTVATGTTTLAQTFVNSGLVDTQTGNVAFTSVVTASGEFRAAAGAANLFSGSNSFTTGTRFTGAGRNQITAGSTSFSGAISSANLEFAGGGASGTATFTGNASWTGGDWAGASTFTFTGGTLTIDGAANKNLYHGSNGAGGAIVNLGGNALWLGSGSILGGDGAGIQVQSGGVFDIRNDSTFSYIGFGNGPFLTNAGTLRKSAGTGTTTLSGLTLGNTGIIDAQTGTLLLSGSNLNNDGIVNVAPGATFTFSGGGGSGSGTYNVSGTGVARFIGGTQTLTTGAAFTGTGFSEIAGGTVNAAGSASVGTPTTPGNLRFISGGFGGSATVTVHAGSLFQWSGGDMHGSATLLIASGGSLLIDGATVKNMYHGANGAGGHTLSNLGAITWTGSGSILGGDGAQIVNQAGGLFEIQNDSAIGYVGFGNGLTFTNAGTLRKTAGTGSTALNQVFHNSGAVEVTSGALAIAAGGTSGGTFFANGTGLVNFTGGYTITGGNFLGSAGVRVSAGLNVAGAAAVGSPTQTGLLTLVPGGGIGGGATLSVLSGSTLAWTGGDMYGPGITEVQAGGQLVLSGSATKNFYHGSNGAGGRTLANSGTMLWTGSGSLLGGDGAAIDNRAGGVFDIQADANLGYVGFGHGITFTNTGLLRKSAGSGTFLFNAGVFNNPGQVAVQSGTLAFNGGGTSAGGQFTVSAGATLSFGAGYTFDGATLAGAGRTTLAATTAAFTGATTTISGLFELPAGAALIGGGIVRVTGELDWLGGAMVQTGVTQIASGGQLFLSGADAKYLYHGSNGAGGRTLENAGLVALSGDGALHLGDGATISNLIGGDFDLRSNTGTAYAGFGNGGIFSNAGLLQKSAGTGVSTIGGVTFTNQAGGLVWAKSGTLAFNESVTNHGGTFRASAGATIQFGGAGAVRTFNAGSSFSDAGAKSITGGTTVFNGDFNAQNLTFSGGTLLGSSRLHGAMAWTDGGWAGNGTFTVASDGILTISGAAAKYLYHGSNGSGGHHLDNTGTVVWQAGDLLLGDGARITNGGASGAFTITGAGTMGYAGFGNNGSFTNSATFLKTSSSGTTLVGVPFAHNGGSVIVDAGTLQFASTFTHSGGTIQLANGATARFDQGLAVSAGALVGTGTVQANVSNAAVIAPGNHGAVGTLTINGTLTLLATSNLIVELGAAGPDVLNISGATSLAGNLSVSFLGGVQTTLASANTFTVVTAASLSGAFANVANGQRLVTSDGAGSFLVNYGPSSLVSANSVVLTQFVAVPEPSTCVLLAGGGLLLALTCRRRAARVRPSDA